MGASTLAPGLAPGLAIGLLVALGAPHDAGFLQDPAAVAGQERPLPAAERAAIDLWESGQRLAAIEALASARSEGAVADPAAATERLGTWLMRVHRYSGALEALESLGAAADRLRGEALYALTRYDEALRYLDPADPDHVLLRVDAFEALGRLEEAGAELERAGAVLGAEDPRLASFEGRRLAREGRFAEAEERFRVALASNPIDQRARFGLGRALLQLGQREEGMAVLAEHRLFVPLIDALEFAGQSLDLAPFHAPNHAALGDAQLAVGLLDAAEASYLRATELATDDEASPVALRLARFLEEQRTRPVDAIAALQRAFERVRDVRLAVRAGDVALRCGRADLARTWFERGLELRPGDAVIESRLAAARDREQP
ncbi:tetratricopeptide repeat protein [Engelhardtia mirabilis]|uniref:Tetratricopeptide repeat protein n=1 Tax=Engelhardtia mirabilis TaxID=2528011 RepID=A0A518BJW5_9BACT|nr:Tetratricopeptide repeat protein [Planctomycetes bacterium Pla133]QDV01584.1 Tetratricopeptide repeat protein [Planctomycetes bacterium Pla86]